METVLHKNPPEPLNKVFFPKEYTMGREFNQEMGSYLKHRKQTKGTNPFSSARRYVQGMLKSDEEEQAAQADIPQERVQEMLANKRVPREERFAEQPRKVNTFMRWFGSRQEAEEDETETMQAPVLDEDTKEALKLTFKWLKRLDPETIEEFKRSPDFERYKIALDKYGLLKKK